MERLINISAHSITKKEASGSTQAVRGELRCSVRLQAVCATGLTGTRRSGSDLCTLLWKSVKMKSLKGSKKVSATHKEHKQSKKNLRV